MPILLLRSQVQSLRYISPQKEIFQLAFFYCVVKVTLQLTLNDLGPRSRRLSKLSLFFLQLADPFFLVNAGYTSSPITEGPKRRSPRSGTSLVRTQLSASTTSESFPSYSTHSLRLPEYTIDFQYLFRQAKNEMSCDIKDRGMSWKVGRTQFFVAGSFASFSTNK